MNDVKSDIERSTRVILANQPKLMDLEGHASSLNGI